MIETRGAGEGLAAEAVTSHVCRSPMNWMAGMNRIAPLLSSVVGVLLLVGANAVQAAPRFIAETYVAKQSDSLIDLAIDLNLGFLELFAANDGVDPWLPGAGTEIVIPSTHLLPDVPHKGIVVNIGDQRLYYFAGKDKPVQSWPIGIGREGFDIPLQSFSITAKRKDPTWVPPPSVRAAKPDLPPSIGPGPDNPLGAYALNLGSSLYRIHGTNMPYGVGRRVSSGCIRMYPDDIETLFNMVSLGTPVRVVNQPAKLGWIDGELYLEVHPEGEQLDELEVNYTFEPKLSEEFEEQVSRVAGDQVDRVDWSTVVRTWAHRTGVPMRITRIPGEQVIGEDDPVRTASAPDTRATAKRDSSYARMLPAVPDPLASTASDAPWRAGSDRPRDVLPLSPRPSGGEEPAGMQRLPGAGLW